MALRAWTTVVLLCMMSTFVVDVSPSAAQIETGEIRYEVDLVDRSIRAVEQIRVPFSGTVEIEIPPDATNLNSSASVSRRSVNEYVDVVTLTSSARTASFGYTISGDGERQDGGTRVNESFIGFHVWPSSHAERVVIALPRGFRTNTAAPLFTEVEIENDVYHYESDYPDETLGFWFVALRESGLSTRQVDTGEDIIEIAGWAGDDEWLDFTEKYVTEGVPVLRELIGQPWPEDGLRVIESVAPTQYGYAGWYDRSVSEIEIPDSVDSETLLHELSHAWFNDRFYRGRWMIEGFAEEFASTALFEIDGERTEPSPPGEAPIGWRGLANWRSRLFFEDNWDHEIYGYTTSWFVMDALTDEIGPDGMAATIAAMQSGEAAYPQEGAAPLYPPNDWRRFLDMLEIHGGSTNAEALFREWVVSRDDVVLLDARQLAVEDYAALETDIPLPVPPGIKDSMSRWRFDEVAHKMDSARDAFARIEMVQNRASKLDIEVPPAIEQLYVEADQDFGRVERILSSAERALTDFEADSGALSAANIRNFQLGRFERIDVEDVNRPIRELNADRDTGSAVYLFLLSFFCFIVLAFALLILLGGSKSEKPMPRVSASAGSVVGPAQRVEGRSDGQHQGPPPPLPPPPRVNDALGRS